MNKMFTEQRRGLEGHYPSFAHAYRRHRRIFGQEFAKNRLTLREHTDYIKLYGSRGPTHDPGTEQRYSNYGFVLLGALIEKAASGMSYRDHVRCAVFQPAGMNSTDSAPETENVVHRSSGYMRCEGAWVSNADTLPWSGTAAGGGYSTVADLFRFAVALEAGKLISKTMVAEATRPQRAQYGYGFDARDDGPSLRPSRWSARDERRFPRIPRVWLCAGRPQQS